MRVVVCTGVVVVVASRRPSAAETRRRGAKDTSAATDGSSRSGPARPRTPIGTTDAEIPASPTGLPVGDDAALCFAHHSPPHRRRKPKHQASRRSRQPPDPVDTVGQRRRYPSRQHTRTMPAAPGSPHSPGSPSKARGLKVRAVIKFGDRTSTLTIPCGDGKRTCGGSVSWRPSASCSTARRRVKSGRGNGATP